VVSVQCDCTGFLLKEAARADLAWAGHEVVGLGAHKAELGNCRRCLDSYVLSTFAAEIDITTAPHSAWISRLACFGIAGANVLMSDRNIEPRTRLSDDCIIPAFGTKASINTFVQ
jgi:hypothetical protein